MATTNKRPRVPGTAILRPPVNLTVQAMKINSGSLSGVRPTMRPAAAPRPNIVDLLRRWSN